MTGSRFTTWTFFVLFLLSLILVVHLLFGFISPVVLAMVIVSIFSPLYTKLLRKFNRREYLAASITTVIIILGVMIPLAGFFALLVQQGLMLYKATENFAGTADLSQWVTSLKGYLEGINHFVGKFGIRISADKILKTASSITQGLGTWFYKNFSIIAANVLSLSLNFLLMVALVFVFFVSGGAVKKFFMEIIPLPSDEKERIAKRFRELAFAVFVGNGLISVIEGILGGLSFWLFGIYGALMWGVVITITAFLPVVGSAIVIIPAGIYLFLINKTWQAIAFLCFNTAQLLILETVVKPRFIGTKSQMHAALVFMSILAGMQIYGVLGLFYGPLLVTIFLALAELYKEHYRNILMRY